MTMLIRSILPLAIALSAAAPALAAPDQRDEQRSAYSARKSGQVMSLHRIEKMVVPRIEASGATYLRASPEYDEDRAVYRLKFQRDFRVFWVEVDARNGREVGRSGR